MADQFLGISLANCVADICRGDIKEDQVRVIYANFTITCEEDILKAAQQYDGGRWKGFQEEALAIALRLWREERIISLDHRARSFTGDGHWVMNSIVYTAHQGVMTSTGRRHQTILT